jgi:Kef-type K+ transport system membrane component KefB
LADFIVQHTSQLLASLHDHLAQPLSHLLLQLLVVLSAARLTGYAFTRVGIPAVVGEMTAGILLGPSLLGLVAPYAFAFVFPASSLGVLSLVSQLGICLFMFAVGAELNLAQLRQRARTAAAVSYASMAVPFMLGIALAYPLFDRMAGERAGVMSFALFVGISMSITAFPVLARILQERRLTGVSVGNLALACAAVDDVTAWTLLTFVVAVAGAASLDDVIATIVLVLLFVATMVFGVRRMLQAWLSADILKAEGPSSRTLTIAGGVFVAASFSTEVIGIHALFGAFLAGAIMPGGDDFRRRLAALFSKLTSTLLVPLFFAFTGLRTQIALLDGAQAWMLCLVIVAVATLGKLGTGTVVAHWAGLGWRESLQLGALLNTRGLMELIALNIGYDLGILSPQIFTILVIMALMTTFMTGPLLTLFEKRPAALSVQQEHSRAT